MDHRRPACRRCRLPAGLPPPVHRRRLAVGYGLAAAGAGFIADGVAARAEVRFHVHPDGWPFRVELPARAIVLPDHPWATGPDVHVVESVDELLLRTVDALVATIRPIVEACRRTAPVGTVGLWNEVQPKGTPTPRTPQRTTWSRAVASSPRTPTAPVRSPRAGQLLWCRDVEAALL